ncbi:CAP domain-containing protein [Haloarchaeobius amylolyticus]|uniref:CAP domain-containing protein n=1 Tax=Haloarchaeobius amylolyticus TaxID=1198296 RepID=UPI00226FE0BF|nr:CAP domain-containing protein [Haloarchaeobius amylolyticus]
MSRPLRSILIILVCSLTLLQLGGVVDVVGEASSLRADLLGGGATTGATPPTPDVGTSQPDDESASLSPSLLERLVHEEVNEARAERGLARLGFDPSLAQVARYHSRDMATDDYFAHVSPEGETLADRYALFGYDCYIKTGPLSYAKGGENIFYTSFAGVSYTETELAERTVTGWLDSPSHRENLLRSYWENEGIGVWVREDGGRTHVYVTQNFC